MIVIPPMTISSAMLTSSSATDPFSTSPYDLAHTYGVGDLSYASDPATGDIVVYESLRAGNLNNYPSVSPYWWEPLNLFESVWDTSTNYVGLVQKVAYLDRMYVTLSDPNLGHNPLLLPNWWEDVGPTNKWAMFDTLRNTFTAAASPFVVVLTPGQQFDTLALLGTIADSVRVQVTQLGVSVYDQTQTLPTRSVSTYYDYFFKPFVQGEAAIFLNIPPYTTSVCTVTFTRSSGLVKCGALVIGKKVYLGITQPNPVSDTLNFSTVDRAFDGTAELIQRRSIPKTTQTALANSSDLTSIIAARTALNAVPAVWAGLTDSTNDYFPALLILGFYRQFQITLQKPDKAMISLELEEV